MTVHGTYSGAKSKGCRDECCKSVVRAYDQHRRRQIAYGRWNPWGDLEAVTAHVAFLVDLGWTHSGIGVAAGVGEHTMRKIRNHQLRKVRAQDADKILGVRLSQRAGFVPASGTVRRLRALAVEGHGLIPISAASGVSQSALGYLRSGARTWAQVPVADAVAGVYERLLAEGPSSPRARIVRADAIAAGWEPPAAWSRFTIDDPGANPMDTAA
ncbi:hypothetical protein [Nocardiopsis alba]|uniref:Uncharacterized protein n=1 Tax=Nocardiopsis alba TaxID=53437 RepID=A0A7K2ILB6_9ACTN|nr:hypothetical protein [Nocardiopsis alba]MYR30770.1 hypothetical protein [Nocardiopsis alba]